jgi:hypothetical protein
MTGWFRGICKESLITIILEERGKRNNTWAMIRSHLEERPPDPRVHVRMPEHAAEAILKALAKKPEERFPSVGGLSRS